MLNMQQELQNMIGFRFIPTDKELLWYYLMPKITGENRFPPGLIVPYIPVIEDLYSMSPIEIANQVRVRVDRDFIYAFTRVKKVAKKGKNVARATKVKDDGSGKGKFWRMQHGNEVQLGNGEVGRHHTLNYSNKGSSLNWVMHEYSLPSRGSDWVICRMHYDEKRGSSSDLNGCSSSSTVEQPQRLLLPPPPPTQQPLLVTGATPSVVRPSKKNKVCNNTMLASPAGDESHDQRRQQLAQEPCEQQIIIFNQPQEIQSNNQETQLVNQAIQDQPQDEHQIIDQVQQPQEKTIPIEEVDRQFEENGDSFTDLDFDVSEFLNDDHKEKGTGSFDESLLTTLDDDDIFRDLPLFFS